MAGPRLQLLTVRRPLRWPMVIPRGLGGLVARPLVSLELQLYMRSPYPQAGR